MVDQKVADQEQETPGMTAVALAMQKANLTADDFSDTPEALSRASVRSIQHMVEKRRKGGAVTLEDVDAEVKKYRDRIAKVNAEKVEGQKTAAEISRRKIEDLLAVILEHEDDYVLLLEDLKIRKVLGDKPHRVVPEEEAYKKASKFLAEVEFDTWDLGQQALLMNGIPQAQHPDLRKGLNKLLDELKAERQAKRQESRNDENARRQVLRGMATTDLHTAHSDSTAAIHRVFVDGHYPAMRYDDTAKRLVPITRPEKGKDGLRQIPVTMRGTFLLTVTGGGQYGQVLDEPVGMRMIKVVPHPDKPVLLNPAGGFRTKRPDLGQPQLPYFHSVVAEMLAAQWKREEEEITDSKVYELYDRDGKAFGETPFSTKERAGFVRIWWQRSGDRILITKSDCQPSRSPFDRNRMPFDFSAFPREGMPVEPQEGESGFIKLVRAILQRMAERHRALDRFKAMKASDTVKSMAEALETGKGVYTHFFENWREGDKSGPVALQVENTGRGGITVRDFYSSVEGLDVPVRTRVPVTLDLPSPDEFQMPFLRMLKFAAGVKKVAASNGTAVEPATNEVGEKVVAESDA